ncbi:gallate 1-beta-glucosyltransferase 84A24-like [Aristolochia californica]|uniref:gallate 1-beta-glucosyltransferase 84A24-like n=1 Tax=Aristolochia californica TaxID=171875 RepID=UPI0035E37894
MGEYTMLEHVLFVSFPGQGHINPSLRLAKQIASKGVLVTFSTNEATGEMMQKATSNTPGTPTPVGSGYLRFEFFCDGWDIANTDLDAFMVNLKTVGPPAVKELIRRQADEGRPVSCVVNNPFVPWVLDVAEELNIQSAVLWVQSCAVFSIYYHFCHFPAMFPASDESWTGFSLKLPNMPLLQSLDLPSFMLPTTTYRCLTQVICEQIENISKASWILVDSFEELEKPILESIAEISPPLKLLPVGPLFKSPSNTPTLRGDMWKAADCINWLDSQPLASVLYASFGSVVTLGREQMEEVARGIRDCGRPFLWVVRDGARKDLPERFEEETAGKGMVVPWSPQEAVLSHPSVACFMTHCGWNSTMESLSSGVPVIAVPQWGDQTTDAKFLVDVYGVGVQLGKGEGGPLITKEEVILAVEEVVSGPRSGDLRAMALKWKDKAAAAVAEGGTSANNIQTFLDDIKRGTETISSPELCLSGSQLNLEKTTTMGSVRRQVTAP